jgi:ABC-type uncharacterized transport system permease subunit
MADVFMSILIILRGLAGLTRGQAVIRKFVTLKAEIKCRFGHGTATLY